MYSLPIPNGSDIWRLVKTRSRHIGGCILLVGSTLINPPVSMEMNQVSSNPEIQSSSLNEQALVICPNSEASRIPQPVPVVTGYKSTAFVNYRIEDVQIPVETEFVETKELPPGISKVKDQGKWGVERKIIRSIDVNGEVKEETINKFSLNKPKKRVVIRNTQRKPQPLSQLRSRSHPQLVPSMSADLGLSQRGVQKVLTVEATAYTYTGNTTATGIYPREGLIAVDPRVIPLGTEVYIEGYGYAIAADTGGAIKGNKIDVFYPDLQKCLQWGRRKVTLHILNGK